MAWSRPECQAAALDSSLTGVKCSCGGCHLSTIGRCKPMGVLSVNVKCQRLNFLWFFSSCILSQLSLQKILWQSLTFHTAMISYVHSTEMRFRPGISESIATAAPVGWNCEASWQRHQFLKPSNHPASLDDEILHFLPYHKSSIVIPS